MIPKSLSEENWKKLKRRFKGLTLEIWNSLDGLKKLGLMKNVKLEIDDTPIFGRNFQIDCPHDIYSHELSTLFHLDIISLNKIRRLALYKEKEIGGTIVYDKNNIQLDIIFSGNENRIILDYKADTHTLFHTHPATDRLFDPPSILDILSYMALIVKYIADIIIDLEQGIEHSIDDPLIVQNSMVFTKNNVYVYYISQPLVVNITKILMDLFMQTDDFKYSVEKLLEQMEISYSAFLFRFNTDLNENELNEYLQTLSFLGIIIKRFSYISKPEVYIIL